MARAWISLLGVLSIVTTHCLGFAVNRSDTGVSRPAIVEMFFHKNVHALDLDNVLRDAETRSLGKEEEKCSSCSENSQRFRRSDGIVDNENRVTVNNANSSVVKESTIVISKSGETRTSVVTTEKNSDRGATSNLVPLLEDKVKIDRDVDSGSPLNVELLLEAKNKSDREVDSATPRNVVLLLVDNAGTDREVAGKSFEARHKFTVQGFLRNCRSTESLERSKSSLGESQILGGRDECECDRFLRANVGSLLAWGRHMKDMATGAVSATNFSIPSPLGYEQRPSLVIKELQDNDETNSPKQATQYFRPDLRANWHLHELQKQPSRPVSTPTIAAESSAKPDVVNGYDGMWDVFDMFSRIRMAFFRILLESLGNVNGSEDEFSGRRPIPVQLSVVELVSDTVRELKSTVNEEGFMMIVATPANELSAVVDVLQSEVSAKDTLLVVAGMCSETNEPIPFFANGPGAKALHEVHTISDLPGSIRGIISNGRHGEICKNKRHDEPVALSSLGPLPFPRDFPRRRIARANEDVDISSTGDDRTTKDSEEVENESDEKTAIPDTEKRSGAQISSVDNAAVILGIVTSIVGLLALNS